MFFFPVYWQQLGLSATQIGILRAFWGVAYSVGAVLFGQLANRWQIRKALLLMSISSTVVTPLVSLIPQRSHDRCSLETDQNAVPGIARRTSFDLKSFHLGTNKLIKFIYSANFENQSHFLNDTFAHPYLEKSSTKQGGMLNYQKDLKKKRISTDLRSEQMEKLDHTLKPATRGHVESKQQVNNNTSYDPKRLISKRLERQLQAIPGKHFVLEKSPTDINTIFTIFIFIVLIGELLSSPAFNLANSEIVEFLGENSREFGKIRLFGPIGHMIAAPTTALLVTHFHYTICGEYQDNFAMAFIVISVMGSGAFLTVTQFGSKQTTECSEFGDEQDDEPMSLIEFFAQHQNFIFITMTFLVGCFDGVVLTFGFWYTKTLDVSIATLVFGFSRMTCSAVSVVFLGAIGICVKKTGYTGVIIFSMLLFAGWFIGMSFMRNPWFMLIFETVGFIAYVVGFTGFISYFGEVTPSHLTDTVQGKHSKDKKKRKHSFANNNVFILTQNFKGNRKEKLIRILRIEILVRLSQESTFRDEKNGFEFLVMNWY